MLHYMELYDYPTDMLPGEFNMVDIIKMHMRNGRLEKDIKKAKRVKKLSPKAIFRLKRYNAGLKELSRNPAFSDIERTEVLKYRCRIRKILKKKK